MRGVILRVVQFGRESNDVFGPGCCDLSFRVFDLSWFSID